MGLIDRVVRVIIAAIIGFLYVTGVISGTWGVVLLILSGIFVLTSLAGYCPLYAPFGLNTCTFKNQ